MSNGSPQGAAGRALCLCALLLAAACSKSPIPGGVFLSLSVSTGDVAVETRINGEFNSFLSGAGDMVASGPVNSDLADGANEIAFTLRRAGDDDDFEPWLLAALEISVKGEIVDTTAPGERLIFQRELTENDIQKLASGEEVVLTETFQISRDELKEIKAAAEMAPKIEGEPATGH